MCLISNRKLFNCTMPLKEHYNIVVDEAAGNYSGKDFKATKAKT